MKQIIIRKALPSDMEAVLALVQELAAFEREPQAVTLTTAELVRDGFGDDPLFQCWVAEKNGSIIGMALAYHRYSTWKGQVLHLEDLIVTEAHRSLGLGTALLDKVIKYASEKGFKRVSWEVLDWNERAISFYESKGANVMRDWDVVQLDEQGIINYLKKT